MNEGVSTTHIVPGYFSQGQAIFYGHESHLTDFSIVVQKEAVQKAAEGFEELSNAAAAKA